MRKSRVMDVPCFPRASLDGCTGRQAGRGGALVPRGVFPLRSVAGFQATYSPPCASPLFLLLGPAVALSDFLLLLGSDLTSHPSQRLRLLCAPARVIWACFQCPVHSEAGCL